MLKELVRRMRGQKAAPPPARSGGRDEKLSGFRPMHVDPDDDQPTREDKESEKAARRPPPGAMG